MRILLTNIGLSSRTGTEIVVRDLALAFRAADHFPMVYTPLLGSVADDIAAAGIPVVSDLQQLPCPPDVIHGHHHLETIQAVQAFPDAPALFVCHDRFAWHDEPPLHPRILDYVGVDKNCRERLAAFEWLPHEHLHDVRNAVDTKRFLPRPPLPERPQRALVFSNYAGENTHLRPVRAACRKLGIDLDAVGSGVGNQTAIPEHLLGRYDLIFAKGRCALEAMAVGAAVVLCDAGGLGPMVTAAEVESLRAWNFGARLLDMPLDPAGIEAQIEGYNPADAAQVCKYIREHATLEDAVSSYLSLYRRMLQPERRNWRTAASERYPITRRIEIEDQGLLSISAGAAPAAVAPGQAFFLDVEVESRTPTPIATSPPHPALVLARWYPLLHTDGIVPPVTRSIVQPPLFQGERRAYPVRVMTPGRPGDYRLRITLMQEGWRYLDDLSPQVFAELPMSVKNTGPLDL